jgi:NAD(P)-dependent dehydrogenase (short-subunit alcohol dehydrogenase family)
VSLVTAGTGGIGAEIARRVAEASAAVVVHYRSDARGAQAVILLEAPVFGTSRSRLRMSIGRPPPTTTR